MTKFTDPTQTAATRQLKALKREVERDFVVRTAARPSQIEIVDRIDDAGMEFYDRRTDLALTIVRAVAAGQKVSLDDAREIVGKTRLWHELVSSGLPQNAEGVTDDLPADIRFRGERVSIKRIMTLASGGGVPVLQP